ncbi:hypothetical protein Tco_0445383 [Tanacetum coccineum]
MIMIIEDKSSMNPWDAMPIPPLATPESPQRYLVNTFSIVNREIGKLLLEPTIKKLFGRSFMVQYTNWMTSPKIPKTSEYLYGSVYLDVTEDQKLFMENVMHLIRDAGIKRMRNDLADARINYYQAVDNGSLIGSPVTDMIDNNAQKRGKREILPPKPIGSDGDRFRKKRKQAVHWEFEEQTTFSSRTRWEKTTVTAKPIGSDGDRFRKKESKQCIGNLRSKRHSVLSHTVGEDNGMDLVHERTYCSCKERSSNIFICCGRALAHIVFAKKEADTHQLHMFAETTTNSRFAYYYSCERGWLDSLTELVHFASSVVGAKKSIGGGVTATNVGVVCVEY